MDSLRYWPNSGVEGSTMTGSGSRFYEMDYSTDGDRWFLGTVVVNGHYIVANTFCRGERWSRGTPVFPVRHDGPPVDVSFTAHGEPIVAQSIGALIEQMAPGQVQRIPAIIDGASADMEPREVLNVLARVACIDLERSYTEVHPDNPNHYRMVANMHLRPESTHGLEVFRVDEWPLAIVVSERVKVALERVRATGLQFRDVT